MDNNEDEEDYDSESDSESQVSSMTSNSYLNDSRLTPEEK